MDLCLFQYLLQGKFFNRTEVAHSKIGIVKRVVGKRFLSSIQDFGPLSTEIASKSILKLLLCKILGNSYPDLIEATNGN
jgi:hypothetical protein